MDLGDIVRIAASDELREAIGEDYAELFRQRVAHVKEDADELYELVRHAISLQNLVDDDDEDGRVFAASDEDEESCASAVVVAEAISASLAVFAAFLAARETAWDERFSRLLHRLSIDLDVLSANLFGGLQRLEDSHFFQLSARTLQSRLLRALRLTCLWAVVVVGHIVGFTCVTSIVLWEWVWRDALWACILAKGALAALGEESLTSQLDVPTVRQMLLQALLGLSSPDVAFSGQAVQSQETAIVQRNEDLVLHRRNVAWAVLNSRVLQVVLSAVAEMPQLSASLASFLVSLLQPDVAAESDGAPAALRASALVALGGHSETGVQSIVEAKNASAMLRAELQRCQPELWCHSLRLYGPCLPPGFLLSLVQLSYFIPPDTQHFDGLISAALDFVDPAGTDADAAVLTAMCFIAGNCGKGPDEAPTLVAALALASAEVKACLDLRWERWMWQGCVHMDVLSQWTVSIEISQAMQHFPDVVDIHRLPEDPEPAASADVCSPPSVSEAAVAGARLQDLMHNAPPPFRCAVAGQLMMDPVETPQGFVAERAALVEALARSGGVCPLSGVALSVDDCPRQPALRRRITKWIRERKAIAADRKSVV